MKGKWMQILHEWRQKIPLSALAVLAVGCVLLLTPAQNPVSAQKQEDAAREEFDLAAFEGRLEQVIAQIAGAGEAHVVLSLSSGSRQVLAQDRQQDSGGVSAQTVTVGSSSDRKVVPVQTVAPDFRGALVVCEGAGDASVRLEVTRAVSVLTGLGTDCICVTTGIS